MARKVPAINASSMADISFLLLIFFLITTSMDVSQGLARRLPQPPDPNQKIEETDINQRNLFVVKINSANQLLVQGQETNISQLRAKAKEFIDNPNNDPNLPVLVTEEIEGLGMVTYTPDHVISVQNDVDTQYQAYLDVQNELVAAYNELRDAFAKKQFGKTYNELEEEEQKLVQKVYPQKISEAEPKNYGSK
ncbi:MAG: biopolymer transporter ExbD [Bacteroidales bacterium]|jgi:biopolymer transport protein ExbD|nr:biopolymer transporter ExbD [Bacteroidales bacterium]MBO7545989.1 biopolymer transporter ExbD [Paludibacteraceae bacterium]MBQ3914062.1 biopolymer transporter ExbD [Paludibacteraceae bacterium]MBR4547301.1 biopolymer transporter ExbD [Paludibacteraceae bacterium]